MIDSLLRGIREQHGGATVSELKELLHRILGGRHPEFSVDKRKYAECFVRLEAVPSERGWSHVLQDLASGGQTRRNKADQWAKENDGCFLVCQFLDLKLGKNKFPNTVASHWDVQSCIGSEEDFHCLAMTRGP